jgi:hypothetical protein
MLYPLSYEGSVPSLPDQIVAPSWRELENP